MEQEIQQVLGKYPVIFGYIFGSFAKGKTGPLSDLDIAVYFDKSVATEDDYQNLRYAIKDDLEIKLKMPEKIDVVPLNIAQPLLEREVVYKGKLIYNKNDGARAHYEAGAIGRWLDWKWYQDQYDKMP